MGHMNYTDYHDKDVWLMDYSIFVTCDFDDSLKLTENQ